MWAALGSEPYAGSGGNRFTEFDYGPGFVVGFADRWTLVGYYNCWTSPAGVYGDGHWLSATLEFDDHGLLPGGFSLEPFLQVAHEFDNKDAPGLSFEPGIRPNLTFFEDRAHPVNAGLLVTAGLGSGYYGGDYGYFATGPQVSVDLSNGWKLSAECLYYDFGKVPAEINGRGNTWFTSVKLTFGF